MIDLSNNRSTLSSSHELAHLVKESDILNDEEVLSVASSSGQQFYVSNDDEMIAQHGNKLMQATARSASVSLYAKSGGEPSSVKLSVKNASLIKKRNSSSPSSNSISFDTQFNTP